MEPTTTLLADCIAPYPYVGAEEVDTLYMDKQSRIAEARTTLTGTLLVVLARRQR